MEIKGYHILSLEAKDIYEQELINGVKKGFMLPTNDDRKFFGLFNNVLDYSLDLIELEKCYQKKYRNNRFSFEDEYNNKYTFTIINLKFTYTYKDKKNGKDLKQLREHFYKNGFNLNGVHYPYKIDGEGRVVADSYGYGCIAYVGVVLQSVCEKLKGILKEKSKILSCDK